jgi:hypothetical protein
MNHLCLAVVAIAAFTIILFPLSAKAVSEEGAGVRSCAYFLDNYKNDPALTEPLYFSWAQGYMSGLNVARLDDRAGVFQPMSMDEQRSYIRNFCNANPTKKYLYAVLDLYKTLHQRKESGK